LGARTREERFACESGTTEFTNLRAVHLRRFAEDWPCRFFTTALTDATDPSPNG
jgi:hypothetical protein